MQDERVLTMYPRRSVAAVGTASTTTAIRLFETLVPKGRERVLLGKHAHKSLFMRAPWAAYSRRAFPVLVEPAGRATGWALAERCRPAQCSPSRTPLAP